MNFVVGDLDISATDAQYTAFTYVFAKNWLVLSAAQVLSSFRFQPKYQAPVQIYDILLLLVLVIYYSIKPSR